MSQQTERPRAASLQELETEDLSGQVRRNYTRKQSSLLLSKLLLALDEGVDFNLLKQLCLCKLCLGKLWCSCMIWICFVHLLTKLTGHFQSVTCQNACDIRPTHRPQTGFSIIISGASNFPPLWWRTCHGRVSCFSMMCRPLTYGCVYICVTVRAAERLSITVNTSCLRGSIKAHKCFVFLLLNLLRANNPFCALAKTFLCFCW